MEENQEGSKENGDLFNHFMFGPGRTVEANIIQPRENPNQHYIDYEELLVNLDVLMESVKNLRPLFDKINPFIEQILEKK